MPPVPESTTVTVNDSYDTTLTLNMPADRPEGDVYVACLVGQPVVHSKPPGSNWNQRGVQQTNWGGSGRGTISFWTLTGGAGEPASYGWPVSAQSRLAGFIVRLSDCEEEPVAIESEGGWDGGALLTVPSLSATPPVADTLGLRFAGLNRTNLDTTIIGAAPGHTWLAGAAGASTGSQQYCAGASFQADVGANVPGGVRDFTKTGANQNRYGGFTAFFAPSGGGTPPPSGTRKLKAGSQDIDKMYLGSQEVSKVYLGSNLLWEGEAPPGPGPGPGPTPGIIFGYGEQATGGAGGELRRVTSLADSGPGTLRSAVSGLSGPTTVIFDVNGDIELESQLRLTEANLTIDGENAPGKGVRLRNARYMTSTPVRFDAGNIIFRHLHVRPGPAGLTKAEVATAQANGLMIDGRSVAAGDLDVMIGNSNKTSAEHILIEHVSGGWGCDGLFDCQKIKNVTVQYCSFIQPLHDSLHDEGSHAAGCLISYGAHRISLYRNLLGHSANGVDRMPRFYGRDSAPAATSYYDLVNNWLIGVVAKTELAGYSKTNVIGNYYNNEGGSKPAYQYQNYSAASPPSGYFEGNLARQNGWTEGGTQTGSGMLGDSGGGHGITVGTRFPTPDSPRITATEAKAEIIANVGCKPDNRDRNTQDVIDRVYDFVIDHPEDVGDYAPLT